jgi:hypothetical protein
VIHDKYFKKYCKECNEEYTKLDHKCCETCLTNNLKNNFINWTSESKKINDFIQKKQLKMCIENSVVFDWVPYNEFINIREIKDSLLTVAIWKEGPLCYDIYEKKWMRTPYEKVCLRYLQNVTDEFINKVLVFSINLF